MYVHHQDATELVALGEIYDGAPTIHNVAYVDDVIWVSVDKVINGDAEVPLLTSEIKYVRQALDTFIAWPTPLVKLVSHEVSAISPNKVTEDVQLVNVVVVDDSLCELIKSLVDIYEKPIQLVWDVSIFRIPDVDASLFITCVDVNEIISGIQCLNIVILQLWTMYMDEWSNSLGHGSVYGFLEPQSILNAKDKHGHCQAYIKKWLKESHREVYPGAYLNHAFKTLKTTSGGKIDQSTPQWIEVKSHVQSRGYECGYYVMHWMWNIIDGELKTD
ncbi:hypothetical protein glysoja_033689 [Glycine soja]|uniref:DUF8039 domain-containing protein n=1 Tax=Glycine soja TaxID=3848 RepID=A0A0B2QK85_GLYSO|nr:hypothetical protein glysoja_033689 [Glycine soja]